MSVTKPEVEIFSLPVFVVAIFKSNQIKFNAQGYKLALTVHLSGRISSTLAGTTLDKNIQVWIVQQTRLKSINTTKSRQIFC